MSTGYAPVPCGQSDVQRRSVSGCDQMAFSVSRLFSAGRVANWEAEDRKLNVFTGLPAMGSGRIRVGRLRPRSGALIAVTGSAGLGGLGLITWIILLLLAILFLSYWQNIAAYPNNGGSYMVAKDNLGAGVGLLTAAALMMDYLLNVAGASRQVLAR